MQKSKKLKSLKDNSNFKLETTTRAAIWQVIQKKKGKVLCNSKGGSTRWMEGDRLVFPL